jgi:hypothetical protein
LPVNNHEEGRVFTRHPPRLSIQRVERLVVSKCDDAFYDMHGGGAVDRERRNSCESRYVYQASEELFLSVKTGS